MPYSDALSWKTKCEVIKLHKSRRALSEIGHVTSYGKRKLISAQFFSPVATVTRPICVSSFVLSDRTFSESSNESKSYVYEPVEESAVLGDDQCSKIVYLRFRDC